MPAGIQLETCTEYCMTSLPLNLKCLPLKQLLPVIEKTVDDGIVHGGAHGKPHDGQIDLLNELPSNQLLVQPRNKEIYMVWQPADGKGHHYDDHHFHHLEKENEAKSEILHDNASFNWCASNTCLRDIYDNVTMNIENTINLL